MKPKQLITKNKEDNDVFFIKIASGAFHNAALDSKGKIYTWGDK